MYRDEILVVPKLVRAVNTLSACKDELFSIVATLDEGVSETKKKIDENTETVDNKFLELDDKLTNINDRLVELENIVAENAELKEKLAGIESQSVPEIKHPKSRQIKIDWDNASPEDFGLSKKGALTYKGVWYSSEDKEEARKRGLLPEKIGQISSSEIEPEEEILPIQEELTSAEKVRDALHKIHKKQNEPDIRKLGLSIGKDKKEEK